MKIVVIGANDLIGSKLVEKLRVKGHDPVAASKDSGVDTFTGEGLPEALRGAEVVVDVASALARIAVDAPLNGIVEIAGPDQFRLDEIIRGLLTARNDPRKVVTDPAARYWGIAPSERALLPGVDARLGKTRFGDWLRNATSATLRPDDHPVVVP